MDTQPKRRPITAATSAIVENNTEVPETKEEQSITAAAPEPSERKPGDVYFNTEESKFESHETDSNPPDPVLPDNDEEWEKKIAEAKANVEKQKAETPENVEPQVLAPAMTEEERRTGVRVNDNSKLAKAEFDMEAEIERRVKERLAQEKKEAPPVVKEEKKEQDKHEEEELEQKHAATAKKNNASGLIFVNLGDDNDFDKAIAREFDEDVRPEKTKTSDPTEYAAGMSMIRDLGQRTQQQKLLKEWIDDLLKDHPDALKPVEDKLRVNKIVPKIGDGTGPKKLSGSAAKAAVISRMKGMFRIQLYNSGFWIDICPPSLVEIDNWMQEVDQDFKELGRCLGGHAHTCIDVLLKKKLCEIIPSLVQRSNYENWENSESLLKNISFHDYDTILWGLCCSLYKDGVGIGVYCTNPDCRYVDTSQYLDIAKLCYLNTEKFPKAALEWMVTHAYNAAQLLTDDDLINYRDKLLNFTKTVSVDNGASVYELGVPSLPEFVNRGAALVGKITSLTNGEKSVQSDDVTNQLTFHLYKMLLPWIKSLSMNDNDGNLVYKIEDKDAIYESLDINTFDDSDFYKTIVEFIENTKLSFYAAHTLKCPKCGKTAELDKDNMFPLDLQYVFFRPVLSANESDRSLILSWYERFDQIEHQRMLNCRGPARNWHLRMVTDLHFHRTDHRYNFNDPKWPLLPVEPNSELSQETDDVLDLFESAGSLIQEVFGMNYWDIIQMDKHTYTRFKKKVMAVYEKRLKDQQEQEEEAEKTRREEELQRQREEQRHRRENR